MININNIVLFLNFIDMDIRDYRRSVIGEATYYPLPIMSFNT